MPLDAAALRTAFEVVFSGPAATANACAAQWAAAVAGYAGDIVPAAASWAVANAEAVLVSSLTSAFSGSDPSTTTTAMESAFATFAGSVGAGMTGFTPTPPPAPVGFADLLVPPYAETSPAAALEVATKVHAWLTTGSATLIAPPFTVLTWS